MRFLKKSSWSKLVKIIAILILHFDLVSATQPDEGSDPVIVGVVVNSCEGSITINVSSGQAPYQYEWKDSGGNVLLQTSRQITSLTPDMYSVVVTDANGKTVSGGPYTITDPPDLIGTLTVTDVKCKGGNDGEVRVEMGNGNPAYQWTLFNSSNEIVQNGSESSIFINISGLIADNYILSLIDAHGCTGQMNFTIAEPALEVGANLISQTNLLCAGDSNGSITVEGTGGTVGAGGYTFVWSDKSTPPVVVGNAATVTGLSAGTYTLSVTDDNGCTYAEDFIITEPSPIKVTGNITAASCNGNSDGAIDVTVTGGTGAYTYSWSNTQTTEDISGLSAGTYELTVTDANNCVLKTKFDVVEPTAIVISESITQVACKGENTGAIGVNVTGGSAPYTYRWSTGAITSSISNLTAGNYSLKVTDFSGCETNMSYTVTEPLTAFSIQSFTETQPSCSGTSDGILQVNVSGGDGPYSYLWSTGATSQSISGLSANTYSVTVRDANGCSRSQQYTLSEPQTLNVSGVLRHVTCNGASDGEIDISVVGGTAPYAYTWSNGQKTQDVTGLIANTYEVIVTDANGCSAKTSFVINEPDPIVITESVSHVSCRGESTGAISISVSGGTGAYTYSWQFNSAVISTDANISGLSAGSYILTVTDARGCTSIETHVVSEPSSTFSIQGITESPIICAGGSDGSLTVNTSGGDGPYTYLWSNGARTSTVSGLSAGTYSVTVTDANGCSRTTNHVLNEPLKIAVASLITQPLCHGDANGSITVSASNGTGPYTYEWADGSNGPTLGNVAAGEYKVKVTDAIGCSVEETIIVTAPDALALNPAVGQISCFGVVDGNIKLSVTGGTAPYTYSWSDGSDTNEITNLTSGKYSVIVEDANGCSISEEYTIIEPDQLAASSTWVDILCKNDNTGSIDLTVTGGTQPYSFLWSNGANTEDVSDLIAGNYEVTITDANGCAIRESVTITEPATLLSFTSSVQQISCNGKTDGAISLEVSGGQAPYTFQWSNGSNSEDLDNLSAGTYTVSITDQIGCVKSHTFEITEPPVLEVRGVVSDISCFGANDGAVDLQVTGGEAPYRFAWAHNPTTEDVSGLLPGSYSVQVTDSRGCEVLTSFTIQEPTALSVSSIKTDVNCREGSDGAIDVTVSGGTLPYRYAWSNGDFTEDLDGVIAGTYTLTVTDANGCEIKETVTIDQPAEGLSITESLTHILCHGEANGAIDLSVTGGTGMYSYSWSNGANTQGIQGLVAGTYEVIISDQNSCSIKKTYVIQTPEPLRIAETLFNLSCYDAGDGAIDIEVSGGTAPYTYQWSSDEVTEDLFNLSAQDYNVTVMDASGCTVQKSFTINQPLELVINSAISGVTCFGQSDGKIDLGVTGGVAPYTYSWSNGSNAEDISGLSGGTYSVEVTDVTGCKTTASFVVGAPAAALTASGVVTSVACNGGQTGQVDLTVAGGTAPYTYRWSNSNTLEDLLSVFIGNYSVTVTDANGCTFSTSFDISESEPIEATFITSEPNCPGDANGSILLTVKGGVAPYTYHWSNGSTSKDQYNVTSGPYTVTIRDANNCSVSQSVLLGPERGLDIEVSKTDVSCKGESNGAISLDIFGGSGPYTYSWSNGATTRSMSGLTAGLYEIEVKDMDGCSSNVTVVIAEPSQSLSLSANHTDKLVCFGGTDGVATAIPTGGTAPYSYLWNTGERSQSISGMAAGDYNVIVTDFQGCVAQYSFQVAEPLAPITVSTSGKLHLNCQGDADGSVAVTVNGGEGPYRLLWNNGVSSDRLTDLTAGDYTLMVTDSRGCLHQEVVRITEPEPLSIANSVVNDTQCFGDRTGSIEIEVAGGTGPYTYLWSNQTTDKNLTGVGTGSYDVMVTDASGCVLQATFELDNAPFFDLQPTVKEISCPGEDDATISLNINGGVAPYTILWSTGETTETITNLTEGEYTVSVTDSNGCRLDQAFVITEPLPLALDAVIENAEACDNPESGAITLTVTGGWAPYQYSWSHGPTTPALQNVPPGLYTVTVTDRFGCSLMETYRITQPNAINVVLTAELVVDCEQETSFYRVTADVEGGFGNYQYHWSKGTSTGNVNEISDPGRLTLLVTDDRGCQRSVSEDLVFPGFGDPGFTFESEALARDRILTINDPISFIDRSTGEITNWQWDFGDDFTSSEQHPSHTYASIGTYTVKLTVTDVMGCVKEHTRILQIIEGYKVMIPDAFTPDGDGLNDHFRPHMDGLKSIQFIIYNTWGEVIYETDDVNTPGWDGTIKGRPAGNGNYVYKLIGVSFNGLKVERDGVFALIK